MATTAGTTNYAIFRIEKLKSHYEISQATSHNYRLIPTPHILNPRPVYDIHGSKHAPDVAKKILSNHKVRKNAVYGFEVILSASSTYFRDDPDDKGKYDFKSVEALECKVVSWLNDTFGEDNIISSVCHLDEEVPHWHAIILPIDPKGKLNARHFTGGAEKLRGLQDSWANCVSSLGLVRGKPSTIPKKHVPVSVYRNLRELVNSILISLKIPPILAKAMSGIDAIKRFKI